MRNTICFDLSLSNTGVAIFSEDGQCIKLLSIATNSKDETSIRLKYIADVMESLKKKYKPEAIVIEKSFVKFNISTQQIFRVVGVCNLIFWDIPQKYIPATSVRKIVVGKGNCKKEILRQFILDNYKNVKFDDLDQSDAFGLGIAHMKEIGVL
jgi:Holliday junction resolvasome RuvABC endonuclease subunit